MASISFVLAFVFCVFAVEAFPNARRSEPGSAFVLYRMPARCGDVPENDICDLGYKIRSMRDEEFKKIISMFSPIKQVYETLFPQQDAACPRLIMKAVCRNVFPKCLSDGRVDYGDRDELFSQIKAQCMYYDVSVGKTFVERAADYKTGIHKDPLADYYTLECKHFSQDPGHLCPKPQYAMLEKSGKEYYERIRNVTRELAAEKNLPKECYQKAFSVFGCSYAFCSADRKSLLMTTSEADCNAIGDCLEAHDAMDEEKRKFLDKVCSKYPSPGKYEKVKLPLLEEDFLA